MATVLRAVTTLLSYLSLGPSSGPLAYVLWRTFGPAPGVAEMLLAGVFVIAGIIVAIRVRTRGTARPAGRVGWFVIADAVVYGLSIAVVVAAEAAQSPTPCDCSSWQRSRRSTSV